MWYADRRPLTAVVIISNLPHVFINQQAFTVYIKYVYIYDIYMIRFVQCLGRKMFLFKVLIVGLRVKLT